MTLHRRRFLHLAMTAAALPALPLRAAAQGYPSRPITFIVPFPPGAATDVCARIVADHMSRTLGVQLIIQNIAGAGGTVGSARAMRVEADGYTILMGQMGTHAAAVALYPNLAYRPAEDFEAIGMVSGFPLMIVARKDFPANDLKEFIAYLKANDTRINEGHAGVGSIFFTACLLFNSMLGTKPTRVPFAGGAPAMNALVGGQVDFMCADMLTAAAQVADGKVKAYALAAPARNANLPNLPTTAEAGLPGYVVTGWNGLFAPKDTPRGIVDQLAAALDKALDDEVTRKRLITLGCDIPDKPHRGPAAFLALVKAEIARWSPIIKAAGVRMD
jgi:tripartite-type tricarboxylate transporter receptor subunit TctC